MKSDESSSRVKRARIAIIIVVALVFLGVASALKSCTREKEGGVTPPPTSIPAPTPTPMPSPTPTPQKAKDLIDVKPAEGGVGFSAGQSGLEDVFGNKYGRHISVYLNEYEGSKRNVLYAINGEYSKFTGTLFTPNSVYDKNAYQMEVYLDGELEETSPIMYKISDPYSFEIPITGHKFMEIVVVFVDGGTSWLNGFERTTSGGIADAKLIP